MTTYKIKTTGLSLKELKVKYEDLFYDQSWYKNEKFYEEKPEAGLYEFSFNRNLCNKTYDNQLKELPKDFKPIHPATLIEAIFIHFKKTGERLLKDWYVRTDVLGSDGSRVCVGGFGTGGLSVSYCWVYNRDGGIGLSAARKLDSCSLDSSESLNLESLKNLVANEIADACIKGESTSRLTKIYNLLK